jgi:hypothetical protein
MSKVNFLNVNLWFIILDDILIDFPSIVLLVVGSCFFFREGAVVVLMF